MRYLIILFSLTLPILGGDVIKYSVASSSALEVGDVVQISGDNVVSLCDSGQRPDGVIAHVETYSAGPDSYLVVTSGLVPGIDIHSSSSAISAGDRVVPDALGSVQKLSDDSDAYTIGTAIEGGSAGGNIKVLVSISEVTEGDDDWTISGSDEYSAVIGNVGIGTSNPQRKLHVHIGDAGTDPSWITSDVCILESNMSSYLQFLTPSTGVSGGIIMSTPAGRTRGALVYNHSSNLMNFFTNGSARMTLDSGGQLGVGTTTPSARIEAFDSDGSADGDLLYQGIGGGATRLSLSDRGEFWVGFSNYVDGSGHQGIALGAFNNVIGMRSVGIGEDADVDASGAISIGNNLSNTGDNSILIGSHTSMISNDIDYSVAIGAGSTSPTMYVLNDRIGVRTSSPNSAMEVNGAIRADNYRDSGGNNLIRSSDGSINISEDTDGSYNITTTGGSGGDCTTEYAALYTPYTGDYIVDLAWIEIKNYGSSYNIRIENTDPSYSLRYCYATNNGSCTCANLSVGDYVNVATGSGTHFEIHASRYTSTSSRYLTFTGMNTSGWLKGIVIYDE